MSVPLESVGINRNNNILEIANLRPVYIWETDRLAVVVEKMLAKKHKRLPVLNKKEELCGIVTGMDVLGAFLRRVDFNDPVAEIMTRDVIYANSSDSIGSVLQRLKLSRRGGFPVVRLKKLAGIISEKDFVRPFVNLQFNRTVAEVMAKKPFVVKANITILDCLKSMVNVRYRRLPVVENSRLVGIVASADLLDFIASKKFSFEGLGESVAKIAKKLVVEVAPEEDLSQAVKKMVTHDVGGLVVVGPEERPEGFITERDVLEEII